MKSEENKTKGFDYRVEVVGKDGTLEKYQPYRMRIKGGKTVLIRNGRFFTPDGNEIITPEALKQRREFEKRVEERKIKIIEEQARKEEEKKLEEEAVRQIEKEMAQEDSEKDTSFEQVSSEETSTPEESETSGEETDTPESGEEESNQPLNTSGL